MTENVSQRFANFDQWPTKDAVQAMYEGQQNAIAAIQNAVNNIANAADNAAQRLGANGRLVYVGAGTSGRLAVQDGAELGPTFGWPLERIVFCMAGGMEALTISAEGAEDSLQDGRDIIRDAKVGKDDVVIGVAASGGTPFTLGALQKANALGALTISIVNNPNTPILQEAKHGILVETGSEIIAGSTRMKAGTAQKAVLNILSTAIMTRLGRVYNGLMVDMIASNKKLEKRAANMVCDITNCPQSVAVTSLATSNLCIKSAVLIALGENLSTSESILKQAGGNLRKALTAISHI